MRQSRKSLLFVVLSHFHCKTDLFHSKQHKMSDEKDDYDEKVRHNDRSICV